MISKIRQGTRTLYTLSEFVVDDVEDVAKLPKSSMGSTVYVIHTKETYMADSQGIWYPTTGDNPPVECDCVEELTIWGDLPEE